MEEEKGPLNPESDSNETYRSTHEDYDTQSVGSNLTKDSFSMNNILNDTIHYIDTDTKYWLLSLIPKKVRATRKLAEKPTKDQFVQALTGKSGLLIVFYNKISQTVICCYTQAQIKFVANSSP